MFLFFVVVVGGVGGGGGVLSYPVCKMHALYCHVWPVWLYHIFPYFLINGTTIKEKVTEHYMYVLIFSAPFV